MTNIDLRHGDCLNILAELPDASVDAVCTDPPYGLEFMGKEWDAPWRESDVNADAGFNGGGIDQTRTLPSFTGSTNPKCLRCKGTRRGRRDGTAKVAVCLCEDGGKFPNVRAVEMRAFAEWCEAWVVECYRVLKPGGHLLAFGGTRTWHRLACAVEDAGFEVRDSIAWLYGSGFSKGGLLGNKAGIKWCECGGNAVPYNHADNPDLRRLPDHVHPSPVTRGEGQDADVLTSMQREAPGRGVGEAWAQGPSGVVAGDGGPSGRVDARREEPGMEGRHVHRAGEGLPDGAKAGPSSSAGEWLRGRTPARDGGVDRSARDAARGGASHQPRSSGQPAGELGPLPGPHEPLDDGALRGRAECPRCGGFDPAFRGFSTTLKPAFEPVVVARKPLSGTVAANVLAHGTGALNIDGCRVGREEGDRTEYGRGKHLPHANTTASLGKFAEVTPYEPHTAGRWPANVVLDESQAAALDEQSGECPGNKGITGTHGGGRSGGVMGEKKDREYDFAGYGDTGGASRFFYIARRETTCATGALSASNVESGMARSAEPAATSWEPDDGDCCDDCEWEREHDYGLTLPLDQLGARFRYVAKADASERVRVNGTAHPTVKPLALMRWLVRLVTPPGGTVLEPFAGSGTTVEACILEGFDCIAIEREADYLPLIRQRINRRRDPVEAVRATGDDGGLFDLLDEEPA